MLKNSWLGIALPPNENQVGSKKIRMIIIIITIMIMFKKIVTITVQKSANRHIQSCSFFVCFFFFF